MIDEDSPIIDFYPPTFQIDMNGKKMAWQGVALLPFIDQDRLLDAMALEYPKLTEEEIRRNRWGNNIIYASVDHPIYPFYEKLYGKRKSQDVGRSVLICAEFEVLTYLPKPVVIDTALSHGIAGSVLPNPECIPGSTYYSPLTKQGLPDIKNDCSLSVLYFFPKQLTPHRSVILPGTKRPPRVLSASDLEVTRNGGRGRGRGGWDRGGGNSNRGTGMDRNRNDPFHTRPNNYGQNYGNDRAGPGPANRGGYGHSGGYGGRGGGSYQPNTYSSRPPPYQSQQGPFNGYANSGGYGARSDYGGYGGYGGYGDSSYQRSDYNSYGSYGNATRNGYEAHSTANSYSSYNNGGYGGYGSSNNSGYQSRGGASHAGYNSRGRGRTW